MGSVFSTFFASHFLMAIVPLLQAVNPVVREGREMWVMLTLGMLLLLVALIRALFPGVIMKILGAYYDNTFLNLLGKEDRPFGAWPFLILYIVLGFAIGLFVLLCKQASLFQVEGVTDWQFYLLISGAVISLFYLKIVVLNIIGSVFDIREFFRNYILVLYLIYYNVGFGLLGFVTMLSLLPFSQANWLVPTALTLSAVMVFFRLGKSVIDVLRNYQFPVFYFIIYLCTLELAPILILFKIVSR